MCESRGGVVKKRRKTHGIPAISLIVILVFLVSVFFIYADICLRPVVVTMAQHRIQSLVTRAVNNAIIMVMDDTDINYDDLVRTEKNETGEIVSINYNSLNINKLRSSLVHAAIEQTQKVPATNVYIPVGNMTNIDIFQNKGPKLKFTITPSSYVEAEVESVFKNTGINQINHQIFINIKVTANALIPNYSTSVVSVNKVCVAETVIIGKVPDSIGNGIIYSDD